MSGTAMISTHHLPIAGRLREAFRRKGYEPELVTPDETLGSLPEPALLLLTPGADRASAENLAHQAVDLGAPIFALVEGDEARQRLTGLAGLLDVFDTAIAPDEVVLLAHRTLERRRLQAEIGIVGETEAVKEVLERVVQIAPVASTVLITGESGTGKELVARGLHALSPRRHKPFLAVNVAALSETLLESELFGHEKGAFTGAIDTRKGMFELAHGGTIFLDEIGEMPLTTQTKLLRVLEQREFLRVGGEKPLRVDVRIITATNQDLRQLVMMGEFRRDLYYRLNVLRIELPALRERRDDIPLLVQSFVREVAQTHDRPFVGISPAAMQILKDHSWPGNVRELRNLVESMVVLAPGRVIGPSDIPPEIRVGPAGKGLLPVPVVRAHDRGRDDPNLRPELEFIFRTLVELRVDMDELKREFETYREEVLGTGRTYRLPRHGIEVRGVDVEAPRWSAPDHGELGGSAASPVLDAAPYASTPAPGTAWHAPAPAPAPDSGPANGSDAAAPLGQVPPAQPDEGIVLYRAGMRMDEVERRTIQAALDQVEGNRRKAARLLGIGERTLYRKIKEYGLEP